MGTVTVFPVLSSVMVIESVMWDLLDCNFYVRGLSPPQTG
jgi:hypothetical protein